MLTYTILNNTKTLFKHLSQNISNFLKVIIIISVVVFVEFNVVLQTYFHMLMMKKQQQIFCL